MMSESRTELLAWLNELTQLGYTKVEQCGTGAAHCMVMDSIYKDVSRFLFLDPSLYSILNLSGLCNTFQINLYPFNS